MKPGTWTHTLAVVLSSLASAIAHPASAKTSESKNSTKKNGKKKETVSLHVGDTHGTPPLNDQPLAVSPPVQPTTAVTAPTTYPWKKQIVTTTFWIGEKPCKNNPVPNNVSCWDQQWSQNYGGTDEPEKTGRRDYRPVSFTPKQNPFYVALPYNDKMMQGHKPEAAEVIPWFKKEYNGPGKSVCKGRWIAVKFGDKICYAQWEDAGPFRTDHWQYVFGDERPKPNLNKGAGLDVSPAVRDFLGMNDTDVTDWKFVEFEEIPNGPWADLGDNNTFVMNKKKADERMAQIKTKNGTVGVD